ncbi:unnamed protein product, partial [marine sediment metagenome]
QRRADVSRARELLGFEAQIGIREGLKELVADMVKHPDRY